MVLHYAKRFIRRLVPGFLVLLALCTAAFAQGTYTIDGTVLTLQNLYSTVETFTQNTDIVFTGDDDSLNNTFGRFGFIVYGGTVTLESNTYGTARAIGGTGTSLFTLGRTQATLILTENIIISEVRNVNNITTGFQNGALCVTNGTLTVDGATFDSNVNTNFRIEGMTPIQGIGFGGAISVFQSGTALSETLLNGAIFTANAADGGGAVAMAGGTLGGTDTLFRGNISDFVGGGALLLLEGTSAVIWKGDFRDNEARNSKLYLFPLINPPIGDGGAISAAKSDLDVKGGSFVNNRASGRGGAIFFAAAGQTNTLTIGAFANETATFSGNTDTAGLANSIVFSGFNVLDVVDSSGTSAAGSIVMNVDVEQNATLDMRDPMAIDMRQEDDILNTIFLFRNAQNIDVTINKIGTGTWNLDGNSQLGAAAQGTRININAGVFRLLEDAELHLTNAGHDLDYLGIAAGATLRVDGNNEIETSRFRTAAGSTMQLDGDLTLNITDTAANESEIAGTLSGDGALTKAGAGKLTFSGTTSNYGGDLTVQAGDLVLASPFETTGSATFAGGSRLFVTADADTPSLKASDIALAGGAGTYIDISGVSGEAGDRYIILQSDSVIAGIADPHHDADLDQRNYIDIDFGFSADQKEYYADITLAWFFNVDAHGTFDIDPATGPSSFTVGSKTILSDRGDLFEPNWDGKSLTKQGTGTLILAGANTYTGETTVEAGTLLLTNAQGTGTGASAIDVWAPGTLALDFDGNYHRGITGDGKVVKTGDSTVDLGNTVRDYHGGTVLEEGVLAFSGSRALGDGDLLFAGGTLRNTKSLTLGLSVDAASTDDARFDTPENTDLTLTGNIAGDYGLIKTGKGRLLLQGLGGYAGKTQIREGTLSVSSKDNLGAAAVEITDGAALQSEAAAPFSLDRNIVLLKEEGKTAKGSVIDTQSDMTLSGVISGDGKLRKTGGATLTLTGKNTYTGSTRLDEGILEIQETANLGDEGILEFNGGTLRNIREIANFNRSVVTLAGNDAVFDTPVLGGTAMNMTVTQPISGNGGLVKRGAAQLTLEGLHTYTGMTVVEAGKLYVAGETRSTTVVRDRAALAGSGKIFGDVYFEEGSAYEWYCGRLVEESPFLTVGGHVYFDKAVFRPVTAGDAYHYTESVTGRTVLKYVGDLGGDGKFAAIDGSMSPFFDFELDYSEPNEIRVLVFNRADPRGLSDSVATGINISNRSQQRRPFDHIDKALRGGRYLGLEPSDDSRQRSQAGVSREIWGDLYGRSTRFESTYFGNRDWKLNSFGVQAGYSFYTSNWTAWGVTGGVELPELKNFRDKIDATDGYLGLYYGRRFWGMWEFKGYLGAGYQHYKSRRSDTRYVYRAKYRGDSFQTNVELARPFLLGGLLVRPMFGFDFGYASQQASIENRASSEFRAYSGASLTQLFVRVGIDTEKRFQRGDAYLGVSYSNMIGGQSIPRVYVYYPSVKRGTNVYGANLGQNVFTIRGGGNRYFDGARTRGVFLDLTADVFADRAGGQCQFTATVGYGHRF